MSVINQMLKDLEQRQQGAEGAAVYVAPARQQGWWMLLLTLLCGLASGSWGGEPGSTGSKPVRWPKANVVSEQKLPMRLPGLPSRRFSRIGRSGRYLPLPRQAEPAEEEAEDEHRWLRGKVLPLTPPARLTSGRRR